MRIVFAGTPDYAVPSLKALVGLAPEHEIVAVVTQSDKPKGRSRAPTSPPVKAAALALGIPPEHIFQHSINRSETLEALRALAPDLFCVVAYGGLLKQAALALPKQYCINAHGSLLPSFRGAAPIQAALLAGENETGVCIIKMDAGLDTGPVLLRRAIPLAPCDTAGTLHDQLATLSAQCFVEALREISAKREPFEPQDHARASYAPKLSKDSGVLDWAQDAAFIERFVRAMTPWPGAWTTLVAPEEVRGQRVRVAKAEPITVSAAAAGCFKVTPGSFGAVLDIACASGALRVLTLQPEGKKEMSTQAFLNGAGRTLAQGGRAH